MSKQNKDQKPVNIPKPTIDDIHNDVSGYTAKDIYVLEGLEPVRRRPGMYIGSTGLSGLHHLIFEVTDNSLDEVAAGFCKNIEISLLPNNRVSVLDDGRGIPVDIHKQTKKSALETVLTTLHAGAKFGGKSYKIAGGLHGVGVSVVNALSKYLKAEVYRDNFVYWQEYKQGKPISKVNKEKGEKGKHGTKITFEPDEEIFPEIKFDWKTILDHLREQAYLAKQVKITLQDLREKDNEKKYVFYFSSGLVSFLQFLLFDREVKSLQKQLFYVKDECQDMQIEIALAYTEDIESVEISFANNIKTPEGGMHLTGFRTALTRVLNDYLKEHSDKNKENISLTGDDVREGLVALISIKLHEPQFEGQTKAKLGNPDARVAVDQVMSKAFRDFLEKNPDDAKRILEKCMISARARNAAKTARDNVLRKSVFETATLPGKLADCISNKPSESELFIVEGESAGGSTKQARDRNIQAVLPLRGKILNVEKARLDKMMASEEIKAIILALGTAISENFNLNKLRYHKIILAADADCDGAHIRILLLTLFYRYFKPLVENGYIYIAQPPLYRIQKGKDIYYAYNDSQKEQILQKIIGLSDKKEIKDNKTTKGKIKLVVESEEEQQDHQEEHKNSEQELNMDNYKGISIQRYKGLGEMNPEQLWETTMDPANRVLLKVTVKDAQDADKLMSILMGDEVLPRKKFIEAYAKKVKNLDI